MVKPTRAFVLDASAAAWRRFIIAARMDYPQRSPSYRLGVGADRRCGYVAARIGIATTATDHRYSQ
jgi:hypothetical protein